MGYTGSNGFTGVGLDYAARQRQVALTDPLPPYHPPGLLRHQRVRDEQRRLRRELRLRQHGW